MNSLAILTSSFLLLLPVALYSNDNTTSRPSENALESLAWLDGVWTSFEGNRSIEELWRFSEAGFVGLFREIKDRQSTFLEFMVIEKEDHDVIMRIRHFGPGLKTAWEDKDKPMTFKLGHHSNNLAIFDGFGPQAGEKLVYRLLDTKTLEITGEFIHNQQKTVTIFKLVRRP